MQAIYFLIVYYPFHEFFLKLSGFSGPALFVIRQWPELAIIAMFFVVTFARARSGKLFIYKSGIAPWLLCFLVWSIVLTIGTSGNDLGVAFSEIFVLLRFTLFFATVVLLNPSKAQINKVILLMVGSIIVQSIIAWAQFVGGSVVVDVFKPVDYGSIIADVERSFTSNRDGAGRVLIGTVGDFVSLSYLIALGVSIVYLSKFSSIKGKLLFVMLCVLLFICGSRTIFVGVAIAILIFSARAKKLDEKVVYSLIVTIFAVPVVLFLRTLAQGQEYEYSNFLSLFDSRIFQSLINQRLGVAIFVIPEYVLSGDFLIGFSPDRFYISSVVDQSYDGVPRVMKVVFPNVLEDVYPFALFMYYGIVGTLLLMVIFIKLFKICRKVNAKIDPFIGGLGIICLLYLALFSLGNQSLENRIFSFYFWLIMGLNVSLVHSRETDKCAYS